MRIVAITGLVAGLMIGSTAAAQEAPLRAPLAEPSAQLVMRGPASADLQWRGQGAGRAGIAVCISSTTGRYTLNVQSVTGQGLVGAAPIEYSIRFEAEGVTQTARISQHRAMARFEGAVAADRACERGPNVRLVVSVESDQAMAGDAGAYADQVKLSVEPL
jgi:hypothetical protein